MNNITPEERKKCHDNLDKELNEAHTYWMLLSTRDVKDFDEIDALARVICKRRDSLKKLS